MGVLAELGFTADEFSRLVDEQGSDDVIIAQVKQRQQANQEQQAAAGASPAACPLHGKC